MCVTFRPEDKFVRSVNTDEDSLLGECTKYRNLTTPPLRVFARPVNLRVHNPHMSRECIVAGEGFFFGTQVTPHFLFFGVMDRIFVPSQVVWPREDRVAGFACGGIDSLTFVRAGLGVSDTTSP